MSKKIKCNKCKGSGYIPIGKGIRGVKKCDECNGTGIVAYIQAKEMNTEEAIEFLDKILKEYKTFGDLHNPEFENTDKIYEALEAVLADRQRLLEINEEHKKLNGELREEIGKLEKENKKITEARNWLGKHISAQIATPELLDRILQDKYISKDVIKEKIEKLTYRSYSKLETDAMQQVLEELLQEKR